MHCIFHFNGFLRTLCLDSYSLRSNSISPLSFRCLRVLWIVGSPKSDVCTCTKKRDSKTVVTTEEITVILFDGCASPDAESTKMGALRTKKMNRERS